MIYSDLYIVVHGSYKSKNIIYHLVLMKGKDNSLDTLGYSNESREVEEMSSRAWVCINSRYNLISYW